MSGKKRVVINLCTGCKPVQFSWGSERCIKPLSRSRMQNLKSFRSQCHLDLNINCARFRELKQHVGCYGCCELALMLTNFVFSWQEVKYFKVTCWNLLLVGILSKEAISGRYMTVFACFSKLSFSTLIWTEYSRQTLDFT